MSSTASIVRLAVRSITFFERAHHHQKYQPAWQKKMGITREGAYHPPKAILYRTSAYGNTVRDDKPANTPAAAHWRAGAAK